MIRCGRAVLALVAVIGSAGCQGASTSGSAAEPHRGGRAAAVMLPESLLEPPALNDTDRAILKQRRVVTFCSMVDEVTRLSEPSPYDARRVPAYARLYWAYLGTAKLAGKVRDSNAGNPGPIEQEPPLVADAIRIAQAEMWAYEARTQFAAQFAHDTHQPASYLHAAFDDAFVQLANSEFTRADGVLRDAAAKLCGS